MSAHHKHTLGPEHDFEPERGLPEPLPEAERVLWQGSPDWRALARHAFHVRKLAMYFALLVAVRVGFDVYDGAATAAIVTGAVWLAAWGALGLGLVAMLASLSATQALYTITNKRVVMRIGIVLTVTYNLPFRQIEGAGLLKRPDGSGDIPLQLAGQQRIAYLQLWPHARPWQLRRPQPMLRCIADAPRVAALLSQAWQDCPDHGSGLNAPGSRLRPLSDKSTAGSALRPVRVPLAQGGRPAMPDRLSDAVASRAA